MRAIEIQRRLEQREEWYRQRKFSLEERLLFTTSDVEKMEIGPQLMAIERALAETRIDLKRARTLVRIMAGPPSPPVRVAPPTRKRATYRRGAVKI
jgi:hypothetical protein